MYEVMIVDDMDITRREIKRLKTWETNGKFKITQEASNGYEALKMIMGKPVDMVITDIKMPKMDGLELLQQVVELDRCPCVVLLSEFCEFSYARKGMVWGAFDYLTKPLVEAEFSHLLDRAAKHLEVRKLMKDRNDGTGEGLEITTRIHHSHIEERRFIASILKGEEIAVDSLPYILNHIKEANDHNAVRLCAIFDSMLSFILTQTTKTYPLLGNYIELDMSRDLTMPGEGQLSSLQTDLLDLTKSIVTAIRELRFNDQGNKTVNQLCSYVLEHVEDNISIKNLAETLYINKTYLSDLFKEKTGAHLIDYITMVKMQRAKKLLIQSQMNVYEIAQKLGYEDPEYFSKVFKEITSLTPTQFRRLQII